MKRKTNIIPFINVVKKRSNEIVFVKNLILKPIIGYHAYEKIRPQKIRLNIQILNSKKKVEDGNLRTIINYEEVVELVKKLLLRKYNFLESFAEDFFKNIFKNKYAESAVLKIEKLEVIKDVESVGIEFFKQREEYEKS
jgi:dihydroneopterin aldolase